VDDYISTRGTDSRNMSLVLDHRDERPEQRGIPTHHTVYSGLQPGVAGVSL